MAKITISLEGHIDKALQRKLEAVNNPTTMIAIYNTLAKRTRMFRS